MLLGRYRQILPYLSLFAALALAPSPAAWAGQDVSGGAAPAATRPTAPKTNDPATPKKVSVAGGDVQRTRFLIGLERQADYQVFALTNPNRVIIDLPEMKLQLPGETGGTAVGLVSAFRAGLSAPGRARIVIDVTGPVVIDSQKIEKAASGKGYHLAIDIVAAVAKAPRKPMKFTGYALGAADVQPPLPRQAERPSVKDAKMFKPVVVIDPGHGGHDSGAMKNGTVEKDVVLAFAMTLKKKLEDSGRYRVLMTRDTDVFIELGDRLKFAETHNAALFIAVHADYAQTKARGATIYSLRDSVANSLERSTKGEISGRVLTDAEAEKIKKAGDDSDVSTVKNILGDLVRREVDTTKERTILFTRAVIDNMSESTTMREEPDQQAAFRVLKTAQFPSVLIELAYVTNKEDAEQLQSDSWRGKVADSIATAVDTYFTQQVARLPM